MNEFSRSLSLCREDPGEKLQRPSRNARRHWAFVILLLTLLFSCASAWAQKDTGVITGTVKDQSGAVVVGAKVRVTDVDRTTKFDTTTDGNGEYVAGPLKVGRYTITVEKTNFKTSVAGPVQLDVQSRIEADVKLEIGQVSQEVEVTVQNPLLETETSTMGQVMDETRIETLPLNGRNLRNLPSLALASFPANRARA